MCNNGIFTTFVLPYHVIETHSSARLSHLGGSYSSFYPCPPLLFLGSPSPLALKMHPEPFAFISKQSRNIFTQSSPLGNLKVRSTCGPSGLCTDASDWLSESRDPSPSRLNGLPAPLHGFLAGLTIYFPAPQAYIQSETNTHTHTYTHTHTQTAILDWSFLVRHTPITTLCTCNSAISQLRISLVHTVTSFVSPPHHVTDPSYLRGKVYV